MLRVSLVFVIAFVFAFAGAEISCPTVYDGLTNGNFDLTSQFSVSQLSANWKGLSPRDVLGYEWAIVSETKLNKERLSDDSCRLNQGFPGIPDVQNWVDVKKDTSATATGLQLEPRQTYHVVLRTTLSNGVHVFSISNGIIILPQELNLEGSQKKSVVREQKQVEQKSQIVASTAECPIDEQNRCVSATVSVREKLSELYGPPRFFAAVAGIIGDDDDDDDDDDGGGPALIFLLIPLLLIVLLALCLICLALLAAALLSKREGGGGSKKFTENVTTSTQDHVDADFGSTTEHKLADDTATVEFPSLDPSTRLSVA